MQRTEGELGWLAGQKEAFQAAMNGAPLEISLGILIRTAIQQADTERRCAFYATDADGGRLRHVTGMPETYARCVDGFEVSPESLACGLAVSKGKPVITRDVAEEPRWKPWLWLAQKYDYRGCWSFPIETSAGKMVGSLAMYFTQPRKPSARDLELAAALTDAASIIISRHQESERRHRADQALRDSERRFREAIESLPAAVYTTDAEGRISMFNRAAVDFSGRVPELGKDSWCVSWKLYYLDGTPMPHDQCPMAIALKEGRSIRGVEAIAERPDGTRIHFAPYPTPLRDASGKLIGAINMLVDISELKQAELAAQKLAAIVESSGDAIMSTNLDGTVTSWNRGAGELFGYEADEILGHPVTTLIPSEREHEEANILERIRRGERIEHFETVRQRKDGSTVDVSLSVSPIVDGAGRIIGASKIARDTSERTRAEETQRLLLDELQHRVKNTLASVQAIAQQTLRQTKEPAKFVDSFAGRIQSLARVHTMLSASTWQGADLRELIRDQLIHGSVDETRITAWGPPVHVEAQTTLHLALMLHELGTNANKYGALSVPDGSITICWRVQDRILRLRWEEQGGPPVDAPAKRGFGTTLIKQSAKGEGGEAHMEIGPYGLVWDITLPLPRAACAGATQPSTSAGGPAKPTQKGLRAPPKAVSKLAGKNFLVIEDEPLVALDIAAALEEAGASIAAITGSVGEALDLIQDKALDAALLDGNLRGRPVDEVAVGLTRKQVPFLFVTGYGRESLPANFRHVSVLSKPYNSSQLVEAAARLVEPPAGIVCLRER